MNACLTDAALKLSGVCEHFLRLLVSVLQLVLQLSVLEAVREFRLELLRDFLSIFDNGRLERLVRHQLGEPV